MEKSAKVLILGFLLSLFIASCATLPNEQVWRPWTRQFGKITEITVGAKFKTIVDGETKPLIGSEDFTKKELETKLDYLLKRRGFNIVDESYQFEMRLKYNTQRADKMQSFSYNTTKSNSYFFNYSNSSVGSFFGLGVSIAQVVANSNSVTEKLTEQITSYAHTISMEIYKDSGELIWKGESTWDSRELDIIREINPAFQILLSHLPRVTTFKPEVDKVKFECVENYLRLECADMEYSCPALPFRLIFALSFDTSYALSGIIGHFKHDSLNSKALAAFVDLLQTAEIALPKGDTTYSDPISNKLWKKVQFGGQYLLGPQKEQINVLIDMTSESNGYYIDNCYIATDEEYAKFQKALSRWYKILEKYFDVYEH
jgi:hypothetical protein